MQPTDQDDAFDPQQEARLQMAYVRTNMPGLCLIVVGAINLILGSLFVVRGFQVKDMNARELVAELRKTMESDPFEKIPPEDVKELVVEFAFIVGGANIIFALVTITAGMFMRTLRHYRLTLTGALLTAVPFFSILSCFVVGIAIGVWAVIVLLKPEIKAAFA